MILGLLLGNSSVRYGVLDRASIVVSGRIEWGELPSRGEEIARLARAHRVRECAAGSVRDDFFPALEPWIPRELLPVAFARRDFPLPIESRYERPEEAGTDRLLNAIALRERAKGQAALVVDFGTAVSLTAVSAGGAFLGGLIAAGSQAAGAGIRTFTPRLPRAELRGTAAPRGFIQRSTAAALHAGLYWQVAGGVRAMVRGIAGDLLDEGAGGVGGGSGAGASRACRVFATGGEAGLFAPAIPEIDEVVPDLTLEGLLVACRLRAEKR